MPQVKMAGNQNVQTDVSSKNIFDLIKMSTAQSMTSALPYVQSQFAQTSQNVAPQLAAIKQSGEQAAAMAQSDAGARGMRGSDIEAAGMAGARQTATQQQAELVGKLAQQQSETMAQYIMQAYGMDIQSNSQMYNNLAQAIGQELSQQREIQMMEQQLALAKKQMKENSKTSILSSVIGAAGSIGGGIMGGPVGGMIGNALFSKKSEG